MVNTYDTLADQQQWKGEVKNRNHQKKLRIAQELDEKICEIKNLRKASENGASNWLSALLLEEYIFYLHKESFLDAISSIYRWHPSNLPSDCVWTTPSVSLVVAFLH